MNVTFSGLWTVLCVFIINQSIFSQGNVVGINTATPDSTVFLHIANDDIIKKPSLRLDSIPELTTKTVRWLLAVDSVGRIISKINAKDSLPEILNNNSLNIPTVIPWNRATYFGSGGGYPLTNYYRDTDDVIIATQRPISTFLLVFIKNKTPIIRDIAPDFGVVSYLDMQVSSGVVLNEYLYLSGVTSTGNRFVNRYDLNNFGTPTVMTFSGAKVLTNSTGDIAMSCDGTYFYFSHECGMNTANDNVITKHSLSGTNFSYVSTTTLVGATGQVGNLIVHPTKGYVTKKQFQPIKNFNPDGTVRGFSRNFAGTFFMNDRGNFYSGMTTEPFYEIFYLE